MTSGPGMGPYRPLEELILKYTTPSQLEISRSVGLGIFTLSVRGDVNPGDIHPCLFPGCRSCICMCGWNMILERDPIVPR